MSPKVNINILTWNAEKYLRLCLDSALSQNYPNYEILVIDNNSKDRTVEMVEKYIQDTRYKIQDIKIRFIKNKKNIGFAKGHNQGIRETDGKYVMLLNQDAILSPDFLSKAVKILEQDKKIAALQPKVLRYDFKENRAQEIFDTTGLLMLKNRRIINRGQGQRDEGQYEKQEEIFGADGAVPIYRREALEAIKLPTLNHKLLTLNKSEEYEYFDSSFFCYKEDVDLAWRLRLYGWKTLYAPSVLAYHERGAGESASKKSLEILRERRKISSFAKTISFRNQRLMQIKNEILSLYLRHLPYILWKEVRAWGYVIFFEPKILKILPEMFKQIPKALKQRKIIMKKKKLGAKEMERWFE